MLSIATARCRTHKCCICSGNTLDQVVQCVGNIHLNELIHLLSTFVLSTPPRWLLAYNFRESQSCSLCNCSLCETDTDGCYRAKRLNILPPATTFRASLANMPHEYHLSDYDSDQDKMAVKPATGERYNVAMIFGKDFILDTEMYDIGIDWIMPPCPWSAECKSCGIRPRHNDSIIVAIDGACRGNGYSGACSSYGVYFSQNSPLNISSLIEGPAQSSQKAELAACVTALKFVRCFAGMAKMGHLKDLESLSGVIIKADSEYLVRGITEWVPKWRLNGFKNAKGRPVVNANLFQEIDGLVQELASKGVSCYFWHVLRGDNKQADKLANQALDEATSLESGDS